MVGKSVKSICQLHTNLLTNIIDDELIMLAGEVLRMSLNKDKADINFSTQAIDRTQTKIPNMSEWSLILSTLNHHSQVNLQMKKQLSTNSNNKIANENVP
ncbi:hypothetical protein KSF78_0008300 [Schistosoma japonicum]|nr:hypothetical protein KSF78_0008300 [Schistosoma japonicum]